MTAWHIAQLNVAYSVAPLDSPALADFMAALDEVNALADVSPGFVWRLQGDGGNATTLRTRDDPDLLVNMSVWTSVEALFDYVYRTLHRSLMVRRREWFQPPSEAHMVLWWIPAGHLPTLDEAMDRLAQLRRHGPTADAFTFKQRYPRPGEPGEPTDMKPEPYCAGAE